MSMLDTYQLFAESRHARDYTEGLRQGTFQRDEDARFRA
jgi:hypothetical protein